MTARKPFLGSDSIDKLKKEFPAPGKYNLPNNTNTMPQIT